MSLMMGLDHGTWMTTMQLAMRNNGGAHGRPTMLAVACALAFSLMFAVVPAAHAIEAAGQDELVAGAVWDGTYDEAGPGQAQGASSSAEPQVQRALAWYDRIDPKLAVGVYNRQAIHANFAIFPFTPDPSTEEFITSIAEDAREIGQTDDLYASVMIAQAILESGSGSSGLSKPPYNNLFGIKGSYKGHNVALWTSEDDGTGYKYDIVSAFRSYPSTKESLQDYADLLRRDMGAFYAPAWKSNARTYVQACNYLQGHYATDTTYSGKLQAIILTYDLVQYDRPAPKAQALGTPNQEKAKELLSAVALGGSYVATEALLVHADGSAASAEELAIRSGDEAAGTRAQEVSLAEEQEASRQADDSPLSGSPVSPVVPIVGVSALAVAGILGKAKVAGLFAALTAR